MMIISLKKQRTTAGGIGVRKPLSSLEKWDETELTQTKEKKE